MPPLAIAAGIGATGSIGSAIIGSGAASDAAAAQIAAAKQGAGYVAGAGQNALNFQTGVLGQTEQQLAPYLTSGTAGLANLDYLLGIQPQGQYAYGTGYGGGTSTAAPGGTGGWPGAPTAALPGTSATAPLSSLVNPQLGAFGSLAQGWNQPFVAPTGATEANDPGYQFRLQQGVNALQNSAAARGTLLSGGTAADIARYGQDYASNEYSNVYNRALQQYQQAYNIFQQNQANQYNRLASLAGVGQQTAGQLGQFGQAAAGNVGNILQGSAADISGLINRAGQAQASGYINRANEWGGALGNISQLGMLAALGRQPGGSTGSPAFPGMTPGMISGAYGGPTQVPLISS